MQRQRKKQKRIVIIDDDSGILEALRLLFELRSKGDKTYEVNTSKNGSIVASFNGKRPDLILLDLRLSGEDGADIARRLKRWEHTKHIPIIMMSAHPSAERHMRESGADDFLPKPFDISTMFHKIDKLTRH